MTWIKSLIDFMFLVMLSKSTHGWLFKRDPFKVCYGSLGCFSSKYPYSNTPAILPRSPTVIGTKFLLVARENDNQEELTPKVVNGTFSCGKFRHDRPTKMIIHGYIHTVDAAWVRKMVSELLKHADYNIILVDWRGGNNDINYMQCASNIRVVGALIAKLLTSMKRHCDLDLSDVHIIGHSLGAHTAGYAGEALNGIGRITGLDPAGPLFEGKDPAVRLDPDDAILVDVIHTDGEHLFDLGFGLKTPSGDVDFYPNGGRDQPGCPTSYFAQLRLMFKGNFDMIHIVGCSHLRAVYLFTESINSKCLFKASPCSVIMKRQSDLCTQCRENCAVMGLHTDPTTPPGKYALVTGSRSPYCTVDIE